MNLEDNPFLVLGASTRDNRQRILELAQEHQLRTNDPRTDEARAILTSPRKRVDAEVSWFLGISPKRVKKLLETLESEPESLLSDQDLPPLCQATVLAEGFRRLSKALTGEQHIEWILAIATAYDKVDATVVEKLINEERAVAHIPPINDADVVIEALQRYQRQLVSTYIETLEHLRAAELVEIVTRLVEIATKNGTRPAQTLVDDLVDEFELRAGEFFEKEEENIAQLIAATEQALERHASRQTVEDLVKTLTSVVRNWDRLAQPIQLRKRSRGMREERSLRVAAQLRRLVRLLCNDYQQFEIAETLTELQREVFAEIDRVAEEAEANAATIRKMLERQAKAEDAWDSEVAYTTTIGLIFKKRLSISRDGLSWRNQTLPWDKITGMRWGGVRYQRSAFGGRVDYFIVARAGQSSIKIYLRDGQVYSDVIGRLWKAVGFRLLGDFLRGLRNGKRYKFREAIVDDHGIELPKPRLFGVGERVYCTWESLSLSKGNGCLVITESSNPRVSVNLPYLEVDNVWFLEAALRVLWQRPSDRLSDIAMSE